MFPNHPKTQAFLFKTYGCLETFFDVNKLSNVVHACICVLSCFRGVLLFVTLWTVAHQASLPMRFSRQEYGNGIFLTLGKNPHLLPLLLNWQAGSLPVATWEAPVMKWFGTVWRWNLPFKRWGAQNGDLKILPFLDLIIIISADSLCQECKTEKSC